MMTLIVGVPDSGKSSLAEEIACKRPGQPRFYIATMVPFGEEGQKRVEKHREQRKHKGFQTVECPLDLQSLNLLDMEQATILLECMSNLIGNELYAKKNKTLTDEKLVAHILMEVQYLQLHCRDLIVVTNTFPIDGEDYDMETIRYIQIIEKVNARLVELADDLYTFNGGEWKHHEVH